jgi:MYXO-CTERM domain-containing protein
MAFARHTGPIVRIARPTAILAAALAAAAFAEPAMAAEPASCLSPDPAQWPASSKPYFMLAVDTSGSMTEKVPNAQSPITDSCGYGNDRIAHARCAIKNMAQGFGGEVNLGLATFAVIQFNCGAACYGTCQQTCFNEEVTTTNQCNGCGPRPGNAATRAGAFIRVPMLQDSFWQVPPPPNNIAQIVSWADNNCSSNTELFASGGTPLNGMLRDMKRYFQTSWSAPDGSVSYATPLSMNDLAGAGVNGSTGCRNVNVILVTDGDESCDTQADAVAAAQDLYQNGVAVSGKTFKIRTHVINFAGGSQGNTDQIAAAGGTATSYFATNEVQLSQALANIIASAIKPETCDNTDNNCNGCTDEGFAHYCNVQQTCCNWSTQPQRQICLQNYKTSITAANPGGDLTLLPCTTAAQQADPASWLCQNPKESCDNVDNNCVAGVDEGVTKCGNPAHCPAPETCGNVQDDDCDGQIDEGCPNCTPSPEICDGCDNDCDGIADDGVSPLPCGLPSPQNCSGTQTCKAPQNVPVGACIPGGPLNNFNMCSNSPQPETCDNLDNDCDGIKDDNVPPTSCVGPGAPGGLSYTPPSQCKLGTKACGQQQCVGYVGPSAEVCDGIDNDCDGQVDEAVVGAGQACGLNQAPCTPGTTACVNGALVCQGGQGPTAEKCDGIDNDCDGAVDDGQLSDSPAAGMNGCWNVAGNCCTFQNLTWCPPPGATCNDVGTLTAPCAKGTLACAGGGGWVCQGSKGPNGESCDGIDNDCNGAVDDGSLPQVGEVCGSDTGECAPGMLACDNGALDCQGDVPPAAELCDGLDNDCDNVVDNGISVGTACLPAFDQMMYPNTPTNPAIIQAPCQPGILQCNGQGGFDCVGGKGPTPEVCDLIDNDCDGSVDETGPAPDGIDNTQNPFPPPDTTIGQACGVNQGECKKGVYACVSGQFECVGGQGAAPEECDCKDNDCDGTVDNQTMNGPALCGAGKDCVNAGDTCQCAKPCATVGEFECPGGQKCVQATDNQGNPLPQKYCVPETSACGADNCASATVKDASGKTLCAPLGTAPEDCITPPACVCQGQSGCKEPCFGVMCTGGQICATTGPKAGQCVPDTCLNTGCAGCGKVCTDAGTCVDNPCTPASCPGQLCKPSDDYTAPVCVPSCAGVTCAAGEVCNEGTCVKTCSPSCGQGQVCDTSSGAPTCVQSQCAPDACPAGGCCDPLTGACGACPCEGYVCPEGQACKDNNCDDNSGSGGGGAGGGGEGGSATTTTGTGGAGGGVFGLPTGGGGCTCEVGAGAPKPIEGAAGGLLALAALALGRRRRRAACAAAEVVR